MSARASAFARSTPRVLATRASTRPRPRGRRPFPSLPRTRTPRRTSRARSPARLRSSSRPRPSALARARFLDAGARHNQAVAVDSDNMHKWRAIQTWASVDSVEASRGRGVGTLRDDLDRDGDLGSETRSPAKANPRASLPALPETLSPITQVAEPPVRVALETIQPALAGGADRLDDVASRPEWATPTRVDDFTDAEASEERLASDSNTSRPANGPANGPVGAVAGKFHSFRTDAEATLELEVAKRRERDAREAIDKMDRAMDRAREERDAANERAAMDRAARAAAESASKEATRRADAAAADAETLRRRARDATERLEANERQLAKVRDALDAGAKAAETAANDASAKASEARAEKTRLEEASAKERDAREEAERVAKETRETLARVSDAAGRRLETLREEVDVLRARLSAQDARERDAADAEATIATLRRRLDASTAGVDGVVARALRRADAQLRNALKDAPPLERRRRRRRRYRRPTRGERVGSRVDENASRGTRHARRGGGEVIVEGGDRRGDARVSARGARRRPRKSQSTHRSRVQIRSWRGESPRTGGGGGERGEGGDGGARRRRARRERGEIARGGRRGGVGFGVRKGGEG